MSRANTTLRQAALTNFFAVSTASIVRLLLCALTDSEASGAGSVRLFDDEGER